MSLRVAEGDEAIPSQPEIASGFALAMTH